MKKKILTLFLLGVFLILPYKTNAYTTKKVDANDFSIHEKENYTYTIESKVIEFDESKVYIYMVKDVRDNISNIILGDITNSNYKCKKNSYKTCLLEVSEDLSIYLKKEWVEDYTYAYVVIVNNDEVLYTSKPLKIEKGNYNKEDYLINERYSFINKVVGKKKNKANYLYIYPKKGVITKDGEGINIKIGIIRSLNVLNMLRYNDELAYEKLIDYAKSDKYGLSTLIELLDEEDNDYKFNMKYMNVINGAYYYIYVEESEYVPEGIMFAQGNRYLLQSEIAWPNETFMLIGLVIFIMDMLIPFGVAIYIVITNKKEKN